MRLTTTYRLWPANAGQVKRAGVAALAAFAVVGVASAADPSGAQAKYREVCVPAGSSTDGAGNITVRGECYDLSSGSPPGGSYPDPGNGGNPGGDPIGRGGGSVPEGRPEVYQVPVDHSGTYSVDKLKARGYKCDYGSKLPMFPGSKQADYYCVRGEDRWKCTKSWWWGKRECKVYKP